MEMNKNKIIKYLVLLIAILIIICLVIVITKKKDDGKEDIVVELKNDYNTDIIRTTFSEVKNENYLISPYNIEIALNLLREGADGKTKEEIDKVVGNRKINDVSIKDKLSIANGVFIKNEYKDDVKENFINISKNKYLADIIYDDFENPDVINNWVNEKTNEMIPTLLDTIDKDYVMGLASALALDVKWLDEFECGSTRSEKFKKVDNKEIDVEMMHQVYKNNNASYIKNDEIEGIILPYDTDDVELEFVALLPNKGINDYLNNLTSEKINNLFKDVKIADNSLHIRLSLPRFSYSYSVKEFINVLKKMGINEAFDENLANFTKMVELKDKSNVYVGEAIHKTRIELSEKGTKAAAVTYFGMFKATGMIEKDYEEIDIVFNKPFIYMIKEKNTGELLFFGTVYEPNIWKGSTCTNQE